VAPLDLRVALNSLTVQLLEMGEALTSEAHSRTLLGLLGVERTLPSGAPFPKTTSALLGITSSFPADLVSYERLFPLLPLPLVAGVLDSLRCGGVPAGAVPSAPSVWRWPCWFHRHCRPTRSERAGRWSEAVNGSWREPGAAELRRR